MGRYWGCLKMGWEYTPPLGNLNSDHADGSLDFGATPCSDKARKKPHPTRLDCQKYHGLS